MLGFIYVAAIVIAFALVYHLASGKDQEAKQQLVGTPWADIGDAPIGVDIRLSGRLAFLNGEGIIAPMSGRTCAAWRIVIEEEHLGRRHGEASSWEKVVDESESVDFLLIDDTGHAHVEGIHITLIANFDDQGGADLFRELPQDLGAFLEERGVLTSSWWSSQHNFRYKESALQVDELVTVAGCGRWENEPDQKRGYRGGTGRVFRLGPLESGQLVVGDDPELGPHRSRIVEI